jgi:hypothetical protein
VGRRLEELAHSVTELGVVSLRRRRDPATGADVHEVKLGDDFLMSSAFVVAEVALADLGLAALWRRPGRARRRPRPRLHGRRGARGRAGALAGRRRRRSSR